jgi:hypothetical protein
VLVLRREPFHNVDTLEKGLFNYQYFNALAKESKTEHNGQADYFYSRKDRATMQVLNILDYQGVTAYFIHVRSAGLKGRLFEIIIEQYQMILHSTDPLILESLRREGKFIEETRQSVIDGYINQKYY